MQNFMKTMVVVLLTTLSASLAATPFGYSINSDSGTDDADSLYRIDLETGTENRKGKVNSLDGTKIDVEGLAFAPNGTLYGVDDDSMTLFPLDTDTGQVQGADEAPISLLPIGGGNDFGLTFACDGNLYLTSVAEGSLYRLNLNGIPELIGPLGENISALAAYGDPVALYGLGNGMDGNGKEDSPNLYKIDLETGAATKVGALGDAADPYSEGGLAFDDTGQLWAILDSRENLLPSQSQILKIDTTTGTASDAQFTLEEGFESLAITVPEGCIPDGMEYYQGIPALSHYGLLLFSALMLLTGMAATRRF